MVIFHPYSVNKSLKNNTLQPVWLHDFIIYKLYTDYIENWPYPQAYSEAIGGIFVLSRTIVNYNSTPLRD